MSQLEFNPVIKAVQSLRKLSMEIKTDNDEILQLDKEILLKIEEAGKILLNNTNEFEFWIEAKQALMKNILNLRDIITKLEEKFSKKDTSKLVQIWQFHDEYKDAVVTKLREMENIGGVIFIEEKLNQWNEIWNDINNRLDKILSISETYQLKLKMMEHLKPEEIDDLTMDILKYIPWNYTEEEAYHYEEEYMQAYNELKEAQLKKKNLWDKILDILAGGVQETPAHRVQMRRWMESDN